MGTSHPATGYVCDSPACDSITFRDHSMEFVTGSPPPEGWYAVYTDEPGAAPLAFCSPSCLVNWLMAKGEV